MKFNTVNINLAPVVVFAYKRVDTLSLTIEALAANSLAKNSDLIVFSDGPKGDSDSNGVKEVRNYLNGIEGFNSVQVIAAETNRGLANSIINGVKTVLESKERIIVVEDDVITSPNFLSFMNAALDYYHKRERIFSISGWSMPIKTKQTDDVYFTKRSNSACWGTWKDRWQEIDWEIKDYSSFQANTSLQKKFNLMGSDMSGMLHRQMTGKIDSWAIRWCYHQFKYDLFSVYPILSKSVNIGFDSVDASHTKEKYSRFKTQLDTELKETFLFKGEPILDKNTMKQFLRPHSLVQRVKYKLINTILR